MTASLGRSGAAQRTLTALLKQLPGNGVGSTVARDTWHPDSGKHWEITAVRPKKKEPELLEAYGVLYYHGKPTHERTKRIASVWKYGWYAKDHDVAQAGASTSAPASAAAARTAASAGPASSATSTSHAQGLAPLPMRRGMPESSQAAGVCVVCSQPGHGPGQCPQRLSHTCAVCQGSGHLEGECPQRFKHWSAWLMGKQGQRASASPQ